MDLPGGHHGIRLGLLFGFSSPESYLRRDEGMENIHFNSLRILDEEQWETKDWKMPGLCAHDQSCAFSTIRRARNVD